MGINYQYPPAAFGEECAEGQLREPASDNGEVIRSCHVSGLRPRRSVRQDPYIPSFDDDPPFGPQLEGFWKNAVLFPQYARTERFLGIIGEDGYYCLDDDRPEKRTP